MEYAYDFRLQPTLITVTATLYSSLITTILAYAAWNYAVDIVGAARAAAFLNTVPLFSALLATTILGEHLEAYHILGFALILGGVTLVARQPQGGALPAGAGAKDAVQRRMHSIPSTQQAPGR